MPIDVDHDMQELLALLGTVVVPRSRKAAVKTNYHAPYYSRSRYIRI